MRGKRLSILGVLCLGLLLAVVVPGPGGRNCALAQAPGREGGYTRILRTGYRAGDGAELAILEYLPAEEKKAAAKGKKKAAAKKGPAKAAAAKKAPEKTPRAKGREPATDKGKDSGAPRAPRRKKASPEEK